MSATRTMGISVTDVDTEAKLPLGFVYREPASGDNEGEKHWIYVYNDEPTNPFAVGGLVERDAATSTYDGIISTGAVSPQRIMGVAQHAIAAASYGFVLRQGIGVGLCDGNVTANVAFCPDATASYATDVAAVTHAALGVALATDAGAGTTVAAYIKCTG